MSMEVEMDLNSPTFRRRQVLAGKRLRDLFFNGNVSDSEIVQILKDEFGWNLSEAAIRKLRSNWEHGEKEVTV